MKRQITAHILMVRPANFGFNEQTAVNNAFQARSQVESEQTIQAKAIQEFDNFVIKLQEKGVDVTVAQDTTTPVKPDAIFPNNWITLHQDGTLITYPMFAPIRALERSKEIENLIEKRFKVKTHIHLEHYEGVQKYLEGTGSMILDRINEIVYACLSPRTDPTILDEFCELTHYKRLLFNAVDGKGKDIYHTNVMMALGETFVVICMDTIRDENQRNTLIRQFEKNKKEIIEISIDQMLHFAGNMLQVTNTHGQPYLIMSQQALDRKSTRLNSSHRH